MAVVHVDVPCNWRGVKNVLSGSLSGSTALWPTVEALETTGRPVINDEHSVLVRLHERAEDFTFADVRDWLNEAVPRKFKMFNRFHYVTYSFKTVRVFEGVNFRFSPGVDGAMVYFKMAFGGA